MSLQDYVKVLRDRWRIVIVGALVGLAAAGAVAQLRPPQYTATITFMATAHTGNSTTDAYQGSLLSQQRVKSYVELLTSRGVGNEVVEILRLPDSPEDVAKKIKATSTLDTVLIDVSVTDSSASKAAQIAEAVGDAFPSLVGEWEQPLTPNSAPAVAVRLVQPAAEPTSSSLPGLPLVLASGLLAGLVLGVGLAMLLNYLDRSIRSVEQLGRVVDVTSLGSVPFDRKAPRQPIMLTDDPSPRAEAYQSIGSIMQFADSMRSRKVVLMVGSMPGEGATTTLCNVAVALAATGMRVLVVDADLRNPKVADYLGLRSDVGLADVLTKRVPLERAIQRWCDKAHYISVITSGAAQLHPRGILASEQLRLLLEAVAKSYDLVLVDVPPVLTRPDFASVAPLCDAVVLTCRLGRTTSSQVERAAAAIESVSAPLICTVGTMAPPRKQVRYAQQGPAAVTREIFDSESTVAGLDETVPRDREAVRNEVELPNSNPHIRGRAI
jgi:capsular exopolysaccharide synthesis family protein